MTTDGKPTAAATAKTGSIADRLRHLAEIGTVISCPEMALLGADHDPPIVVGHGEINVLTSSAFGYELLGVPEDFGHAMRALRRIEDDPYDGTLRERLTVTTSDGLDLMGGWTIPKVRVREDGTWTFTGEIESLSFHEKGAFTPGTEVGYLLPRQHRARIFLRRFFPPAADGELPRKTLCVLGSEITLTLDDDGDLLLIEAPASTVMMPTYTENWLGEPLRVMFGQLIFPRFVLRRTESWSMAWVRPSPRWSRNSDHCALWQGPDDLVDGEPFWETYRRLLTLVVSARDGSGNRNFEAHTLTELYGETIQAASGSRWVWALTYASAVEALVKMLGFGSGPRTDISTGDLDRLKNAVADFNKHVDKWDGDKRPVEPAKRAASRLLTMSAVQGLRQLRDAGHVTAGEYGAWEFLRQRVMHGSLVSPYSGEEEDRLLLNLAGLFRALTRYLLASVDPEVAPAS